MRLYLAVHPDERFRAALATRLDQVQSLVAAAWTRPETWHLTLQFLGEWPETRAAALVEALGTMETSGPVPLVPGGLGVFPSEGPARVLFLHLDGGASLAALAAVARATVGRIWPDGPQDTRPLRAHLTLARVRRQLDPGHLNLMYELDLGGLPPFTAERFALVSSVLSTGGARHVERATWPLRKKGE